MSSNKFSNIPDKEFLKEIVENLPQTVYEADAEGILVYVNKWAYKEFGYQAQDLQNGFHVLNTLIPEDRPQCRIKMMEIAQGSPEEAHEYTALRKDGTQFPVMIYSTRYMKDGKYAGLRGMIVNIEDRKKKELLLEQSEQRYQNLVELNPNSIIVHQDGVIVYANSSAVKTMGGHTAEDLLGQHALDYVHPEDRELAIQRIQQVIQNMDIHLPPAEERFLRLDGTYIHVSVHSIPFIYEGRPAVQVVFHDLTEQLQLAQEKEELQNQLYQSQKLEAIGTLAGGIAHDFNNLLTVIIANTELMMLNENRNREEDLDNILHAAKTAATLTRRLLSFSRKQSHDRENFSGDKIISDMRGILARLVGENYKLNLKLDAPGAVVYSSKSEIEHILINLVVNSRDAMCEGGDIDISSDMIHIKQVEPSIIPPVKPGEYYRIIVQDYGCGMTKDVQHHLFDPFFSTKETGKGTGLGLSTVYGMVRRNEGGIEIESEPGIGSCFKILIPVSKQKSTHDSQIPTLNFKQKEKKTVLLIEDDIDVRVITRQMLEDQSYMVYSACDMEEAFALYNLHKDDLDFVITDIRLPDGTGLELADIIQEQHRDLPVLFISGYYQMTADDLEKQHYKREFLSKPFDHFSLVQAIHNATEG